MANKLQIAALALALLASGCASTTTSGLLVTYSTTPLQMPEITASHDVGSKSCTIAYTKIKVPINNLDLSALWGSDDIRKPLEDAGITDIRYADVRTLSLVLGIFQRRWLILYGD